MENFREMFKESLERKDFRRVGLKYNPFYTTVDSDVSFISGRQTETHELFRAFIDLVSGRTEHVAILGNHGSGKTHLLRWFYNQLKGDPEIQDELGKMNIKDIEYMKGITEFREIFIGQTEDQTTDSSLLLSFSPPLNKSSKGKRTALFIDDLDVIASRLPRYMPAIFESFLVVGTWNTEVWDDLKMTSGYHMPKPEVVKLRPLMEKEGLQLLKYRVKEASLNMKEVSFTDEILKGIVRAVGPANPYRLLTYSGRYLNYILSENSASSQDSLTKFLKANGLPTYDQIIKTIRSLDKRKYDVLRLLSEDTEINMLELANKIHSSRVWARALLESLLKLHLIEKRRKGKTFFYFIPAELEDIIDEELTRSKNPSLKNYANSEVNDKKS